MLPNKSNLCSHQFRKIIKKKFTQHDLINRWIQKNRDYSQKCVYRLCYFEEGRHNSTYLGWWYLWNVTTIRRSTIFRSICLPGFEPWFGGVLIGMNVFLHPLFRKQGKSEGFESCDRKRPIWVKISDVLSRITLKFDRWPWKTIGHISFAVSSFVLHFTAIGEIKTGVTVRKRPIWVKIDDFYSRMTLKFDVWPWKTIGHLYYATSSSMHHFVTIGEFKRELQSGNAQFGSKSTILLSVWPCNLTYDLEKQ